MNLKQLLYFSTVCKYDNHVTKASEALHVSQPCITQAIRDLEQEFGVELFRHEKKRLYLTGAGVQCLKQANVLLTQADILSQDMKKFAVPTHRIQLGVSSILSSIVLPDILRKIQGTEFAEFLDIHEVLTDDIYKQMDSREIDVGIMPMHSKSTIAPCYSVMPLCQFQLMLYINEADPLSQKEIISIQDLDNKPLILLSSPFSNDKNMPYRFAKYNVRLNTFCYLSQTDTIKKLVQQGAAASFLFDDGEPIKGVRKIPLEFSPVSSYSLVYKTDIYHADNTLRLIDFLKTNAKMNT